MEHDLKTAGDRATELARKLQDVNKLKDDFMRNMTHEFRTPLNGVLGMARLLKDMARDKRQHEFAEIIIRNGMRLEQLVNNLLTFAKNESKQLALEKTPFDLRADLIACNENLHELAGCKHLDFRLEVAPEIPRRLLGDGRHVVAIVRELAQNAIKFTGTGSVRVTIAKSERVGNQSGLCIVVADTGIGIPPDKHEAVFEKFIQLDPSITRRHEGTGIGLSLVKALVEEMNGRITLSSEVGRGSSFRVELPLGIPQADEDQSKAAYYEEEPFDTGNLGGCLKHVGGRVLVVEDDASNSVIMENVLEKFGLDADAVENGAAALEALAGTRYDLILMDIQMPVMDGLEATRRIRSGEDAERGTGSREQSAEARRVPIIALTAQLDRADRATCLAAGMDDYIEKPFDPVDLARKLKYWLR